MKLIPLTGKYGKNKLIIIDDEDYQRVCQFRWHVTKRGYVKNARFSLHRFILNVTNPKQQIDHINHNKLDNRKENLRITNSLGNNRNRNKFNKITSSKYKGVRITKRNTWRVDISVDYKKIYCGNYLTEIEAAEHYDYYALKEFGEFACINFPNKDYSNFIPNRKIYDSVFRGVSWSTQRNKWVAQISVNKKPYNLGDYKIEEEAAKIHDFIYWIIFKNKNKLNFPDIDYNNFHPEKLKGQMKLFIKN